jgi:hypothetical protein
LFLFVLNFVHAQDLPAISDPAPLSPPSAEPAKPQPRKKIVYREKSYFEFEDTLVNGNLRAPDGSFIFRKNQSTFSSALNLRRSFIPELKASSNDAR